MIRNRGDFVAAVREATTVQVVNGKVSTTPGPFARARVPLAGFSLMDASSVEEVIELVSKTPCARAKGAIEVWPIADLGRS